MASPRAILLSILVLALGVLGCQPRGGLSLERWTFRAGGETAELTLPTHVGHRLPRAPSRYVLSSRVELPEGLRGRELELVVPNLAAPLSLRVDGRPLREVDRRDERATREVGPHIWILDPPASAFVELELTVEHRWTQSGWVDTVPYLRAAEPGSSTGLVAAISSLGGRVALGTLLPIGFAYCVLFLLDRRRRGALFFIQSISGSYYPLFVLGLSQPLGRLDLPMLMFTTVLAPIAGLAVTFENFALGKLPRIFPAMVLVTAALAVVFTSPFDALLCAAVVVVFGTVTLSYHLVRLVPLARTEAHRRKAIILMVAWSAVVLGLITDGPMWVGQGEPFGGVRLGCWGLTVNALSQAVVLVVEHVHSLRRTAELNEQLTARVAELEARSQENAQLDAELRHQVASRSETLARALARLPQTGSVVGELGAGDVIDRRYVIERPVGEGGMGTVYAALRITDDRRVALKVIKRSSKPERTARFAREAMLGSKIRHPNVVTIVDLGISEQGVFYLVMDLIDGLPLARASRGKPVAWIMAVLAQTARGLIAIHAASVVHRDLKPGNILIESETGLVKITDFGISITDAASGSSDEEEALTVEDPTEELSTVAPPPRALRAPPRVVAPRARADGREVPVEDPRLTATGVAIGTPLYTAPEVQAGRRAGKEADVYALALLSIEILAGAHPLRDARALERAAAQVPAPLFEALKQCLSPNPRDRRSVEELALAFEQVAAELAAPPPGGGELAAPHPLT